MNNAGAPPPPARPDRSVAMRLALLLCLVLMLVPFVAAEWRVTWRRQGWDRSSRSSRRVFQTERGARSFADRLRAGHGDLPPVSAVAIERRGVGEWERADLEQVAS